MTAPLGRRVPPQRGDNFVQIIRYAENETARIGVQSEQGIHPLPVTSLGGLLRLSLSEIREILRQAMTEPAQDERGVRLLPPIDGLTEVWASGVTYRRSSEARQEESQVADVYAMVYDAARPELFFKSPAWRVCGDGEPVGVRADSRVSVPEPELAVVCNAGGEIVGLCVCNDVSSRSIEGENPLYLPQAKVYTGACSLGPAIVPIWQISDPTNLSITIMVLRGAETVWSAETSTSFMHRSFAELVEHLFRNAIFPEGAMLSTGTGVVPELSFDLSVGDEVRIEIAEVGILTNSVRCATSEAFGWLTPESTRQPR
jgi:2-dehydro-3-deoxy-D-arabinonate dehydratase